MKTICTKLWNTAPSQTQVLYIRKYRGSIEVKIHSLPHLRCLSNRSREDINFTALIILIIFSGHDCMKVETKRSSAGPTVSNIRKVAAIFQI